MVPHHFGDFERFNFPNKGARIGGLQEVLLLRSPKGAVFSHRTGINENPDKVIFRIEGKQHTWALLPMQVSWRKDSAPGASSRRENGERSSARDKNWSFKLDVKRSKKGSI